MDQNEGHALQILNVLLQEVAGDFKHPGLFLKSAGQHLGRVGAIAAVPPRGAGVTGAVPLLQEDSALDPTVITGEDGNPAWACVYAVCLCVFLSCIIPYC